MTMESYIREESLATSLSVRSVIVHSILYEYQTIS